METEREMLKSQRGIERQLEKLVLELGELVKVHKNLCVGVAGIYDFSKRNTKEETNNEGTD